MSLPDSPQMSTPWCPVCEPDRDPIAEILETRHCEYHVPSRQGNIDHVVSQASYLGSGDIEGESNRAWCELIHRKARLLTGGAR